MTNLLDLLQIDKAKATTQYKNMKTTLCQGQNITKYLITKYQLLLFHKGCFSLLHH